MFSFLDRNQLWIGLLIGLLLPFVGYAVLMMLYEQLEALGWIQPGGLSTDFRHRTTAIVAICLNLWPLNFYQKKRFVNSMRGVVLATSVYVAAWIIYYFGYIFGI